MSSETVFSSDIKNPAALLEEFFTKHEYLSSEEKAAVSQAWSLLVELAGDKIRTCGKPYYLHPLRVADILAESKLDGPTLVAAILHSIKDFDISDAELSDKFGENVCNIILTVNKILNLPINTKTMHQSDAIRNMLFAMCDDARIILITLADRLDRIRNIKNFSAADQHMIASAVIEIWAPLADRLGMQAEKNELFNLSENEKAQQRGR